LRKKSEKVDIFDDEIKEFAENLLDLMYAYD
jgi:peptide deformylase